MENSTSSQINNSSDDNLINHNEYLPTNEEFETLLASYSAVNENENIDILLDVNSSVTGDPLYMSLFRSFKNYILLLDLSLCGSQGQKRPFEDSLNKVIHNKRSDSSNDSIVDDILILKQKYIELESKIKKLEEHWMSSSTNSAMDPNFVEISNVSRDDQENMNVDKGTSMTDILLILKMDANKLTKCNKKTATATARSVIKSMYPNCDSNFRYSDVDKSIIDCIIEYTKFSNPNDKASGTERRRAISNYFGYLTHQRKLKAMMVSNQIVLEPKNDNNNTISAS
ncbi:unnamed protein product [Rotaria sp. Silwood2]|nr:unnamed protein product [Rotaria sp. Silwood2]CAF3366087.1 unnamed protein product [Rotaria sp. Silwood2]CAF4140875.1 unnamed protein product [Rotaria sp. Silwood2]CAF4335817.1 unnamed protein product [Rotaria sp. Silwood2]CAF4351827.1 unnamed protein product [Rotaria sp. Silwood2]